MQVIRFHAAPDVGTTIEVLGQTYVLTASELHQRRDGSFTTILRWMSRCSDCGQSFTLTSSVSIRYLNRRCPKHQQPGRAVTTGPALRRLGRRHG